MCNFSDLQQVCFEFIPDVVNSLLNRRGWCLYITQIYIKPNPSYSCFKKDRPCSSKLHTFSHPNTTQFPCMSKTTTVMPWATVAIFSKSKRVLLFKCLLNSNHAILLNSLVSASILSSKFYNFGGQLGWQFGGQKVTRVVILGPCSMYHCISWKSCFSTWRDFLSTETPLCLGTHLPQHIQPSDISSQTNLHYTFELTLQNYLVSSCFIFPFVLVLISFHIVIP